MAMASSAPLATTAAIEITSTNFKAEVIDASFKQVVLVDFWAEWCGPCKALTPVLEKVVEATRGAVKLTKINIDQQKILAGQFQVKSIPMVYALVDGRPVDAFTGAQTEGQIKAFIDRLMTLKGASPEAERAEDIAAALADAKALAADHQAVQAAEVYAAILEIESEHVEALAGLARCKLTLGDAAGAKALLDGASEVAARDPAIISIKASLGLSADFAPLADAQTMVARMNTDSKDHEAAFALAGHAIATGDMEAAAHYLLGIIRLQRDWQSGAARLLLLRLFEAMGNGSDFTVLYRRQLSVILFS